MANLVKHEEDASFIDMCVMKGKAIDPDKGVNYAAFLQHHPNFKDIFAYDEFDLSIKMVKCPEWFETDEKMKFSVHSVTDEDIIRVDYALQKHEMNGSIEKTYNAIRVAAKKNAVHPARKYFNGLKWDGKPRLSTWLVRYCSACDDDPAYFAAIGTKWLVAGVKRVFEPGCKFDNMLIFEGGQGVGKSTTLRLLATFGDDGEEREYFTDNVSLARADEKDELSKTNGKLICEFAELSGLHKRENAFLKAFLSRQEDSYRPPYGRTVQTFPRQVIFAGSYNPQDGVVDDPTGARRLWFVKNGGKFDVPALRKDKDQLWAEAVHLFKNGEKVWLEDENVERLAKDAADKRRIIDAWTQDVFDAVGSQDFVVVRDIMKSMNIELRGRTRVENNRICAILRGAGWIYCRKVRHGRQVYGFENPNSPWAKQQTLPLSPQEDIPLAEPDQPETKDYDDLDNL